MTFRRTTSFSRNPVSAVHPQGALRPRPQQHPAGAPPVAKAAKAAKPAPGAHPRVSAAAPGFSQRGARSYRAVVIGVLLVLFCLPCIPLLYLHFTRHQLAGSQGLPGSAELARRQVVPPESVSSLPLFIPQVVPDARYGAAHPGWERYEADALEYLVFREKGRVRAVQVVSREGGAITPSFFKACLQLSGGGEQLDITKTEQRGALKVVTGNLQKGREVMVYRENAGGAIRGFVLSYPALGEGPA